MGHGKETGRACYQTQLHFYSVSDSFNEWKIVFFFKLRTSRLLKKGREKRRKQELKKAVMLGHDGLNTIVKHKVIHITEHTSTHRLTQQSLRMLRLEF